MSITGWVTAALLALVGALHVVWMFSPWPLVDRQAFARRVVGVEVDRLPGRGATLVVAVLLFAAAYLVVARVGGAPPVGPVWVVHAGVATVAAVLLLRGAGGLVTSTRKDTEFARWDRRLYAPLCLVLGGLCLAVSLG